MFWVCLSLNFSLIDGVLKNFFVMWLVFVVLFFSYVLLSWFCLFNLMGVFIWLKVLELGIC